jgi:hypothetical protein
VGEIVDPNDFVPKDALREAAYSAWKELEPQNPASFGFYLWAANEGLLEGEFYTLVSEIKQTPKVLNKGAYFNLRARAILKRRKKNA